MRRARRSGRAKGTRPSSPAPRWWAAWPRRWGASKRPLPNRRGAPRSDPLRASRVFGLARRRRPRPHLRQLAIAEVGGEALQEKDPVEGVDDRGQLRERSDRFEIARDGVLFVARRSGDAAQRERFG